MLLNIRSILPTLSIIIGKLQFDLSTISSFFRKEYSIYYMLKQIYDVEITQQYNIHIILYK